MASPVRAEQLTQPARVVVVSSYIFNYVTVYLETQVVTCPNSDWTGSTNALGIGGEYTYGTFELTEGHMNLARTAMTAFITQRPVMITYECQAPIDPASELPDRMITSITIL